MGNCCDICTDDPRGHVKPNLNLNNSKTQFKNNEPVSSIDGNKIANDSQKKHSKVGDFGNPYFKDIYSESAVENTQRVLKGIKKFIEHMEFKSTIQGVKDVLELNLPNYAIRYYSAYFLFKTYISCRDGVNDSSLYYDMYKYLKQVIETAQLINKNNNIDDERKFFESYHNKYKDHFSPNTYSNINSFAKKISERSGQSDQLFTDEINKKNSMICKEIDNFINKNKMGDLLILAYRENMILLFLYVYIYENVPFRWDCMETTFIHENNNNGAKCAEKSSSGGYSGIHIDRGGVNIMNGMIYELRKYSVLKTNKTYEFNKKNRDNIFNYMITKY
jgi:hypothetical protein